MLFGEIMEQLGLACSEPVGVALTASPGLGPLDGDGDVLVCRANGRSDCAAHDLEGAGVHRVACAAGGMPAWRDRSIDTASA